jgi:hypothetical protein
LVDQEWRSCCLAVRSERIGRTKLHGSAVAAPTPLLPRRGARRAEWLTCEMFAPVRPPCCPVPVRHVETPSRASYHFPVASPNQRRSARRRATGKRTMPGSVRQSTSLTGTGQQGSDRSFGERAGRRGRRKSWIPAFAGMTARKCERSSHEWLSAIRHITTSSPRRRGSIFRA